MFAGSGGYTHAAPKPLILKFVALFVRPVISVAGADFYEYHTEHPRLQPGDECKSRHKKTEFSSCLFVVGKIKQS